MHMNKPALHVIINQLFAQDPSTSLLCCFCVVLTRYRIDDDTMAALLKSSPSLRTLEIAGRSWSAAAHAFCINIPWRTPAGCLSGVAPGQEEWCDECTWQACCILAHVVPRMSF